MGDRLAEKSSGFSFAKFDISKIAKMLQKAVYLRKMD